MLLNTTESRSKANESRLEVLGYDDKDEAFIAKSPTGNTLEISDTFAEMFPLMEISPAYSPFSCFSTD
jgi:hypothetical protein